MTWVCVWDVAGFVSATVHPDCDDAVAYAFGVVRDEWGADLPADGQIGRWTTHDRRMALERVLGGRSGDRVAIVEAAAPTGPEPLDAARRLEATRIRDLDTEPVTAGRPYDGQASMYVGSKEWGRRLEPVRLMARTPEAFDRLAAAAATTAERIREQGLHPEAAAIRRDGPLGT